MLTSVVPCLPLPSFESFNIDLAVPSNFRLRLLEFLQSLDYRIFLWSSMRAFLVRKFDFLFLTKCSGARYIENCVATFSRDVCLFRVHENVRC